MKSCTNCIHSGFLIEKDNEMYSYEGDCNHPSGSQAPTDRVWDYTEDDKEYLKEALAPIFTETANNCKYYKSTGM
jgi:hypothetical protein